MLIWGQFPGTSPWKNLSVKSVNSFTQVQLNWNQDYFCGSSQFWILPERLLLHPLDKSNGASGDEIGCFEELDGGVQMSVAIESISSGPLFLKSCMCFSPHKPFCCPESNFPGSRGPLSKYLGPQSNKVIFSVTVKSYRISSNNRPRSNKV